MIAPSEISRISAALGVSPDIIEHDYVLGCFLHFLGGDNRVNRSWIYKGGTCLAKCYFSNYRFSEDLDFTLTESIMPDQIVKIFDAAKALTQTEVGILMDIRPTSVEVIADDYGKESFEAKVYYEGVWRSRGSPRAIRVHLNRDEIILFPVVEHRISHRYSDVNDLPEVSIATYALEEVLVEKLRALSGQRKYAVARDLYDLWYLNRSFSDISIVLTAFSAKCMVKGLNPTRIDLNRLINSREEYHSNWKANLDYLVPNELKCSFEEAWDVSLGLLKRVLK